MLFLYADDTVIFAHSHIDLHLKLKALDEYCEANGLTVNALKTKIVIFKASGRVKDCPDNYRTYKQTCLENVNHYTYLGVKVASSAMGYSSLQLAVKKTKCTAGAAMAILAKAKCDSLEAYNKIYDSMVKSVFLYVFPTWGLWYRNSLEVAETFFYEKLFKLPRNTPDWVVRLEFGLTPVVWKAMRLVWR